MHSVIRTGPLHGAFPTPLLPDCPLPESDKTTEGQVTNNHTTLDHSAMVSNCVGNSGGLSTSTPSKIELVTLPASQEEFIHYDAGVPDWPISENPLHE